MQCNENINQTFIIESIDNTPTLTGCTGVFTNHLISCDTDTEINISGDEIIVNKNILPSNNNLSIGTDTNRFREINSISGSTTYWVTTNVITESIDLGLDSFGESRIITANNSVISNDILNGGDY